MIFSIDCEGICGPSEAALLQNKFTFIMTDARNNSCGGVSRGCLTCHQIKLPLVIDYWPFKYNFSIKYPPNLFLRPLFILVLSCKYAFIQPSWLLFLETFHLYCNGRPVLCAPYCCLSKMVIGTPCWFYYDVTKERKEWDICDVFSPTLLLFYKLSHFVTNPSYLI